MLGVSSLRILRLLYAHDALRVGCDLECGPCAMSRGFGALIIQAKADAKKFAVEP